MKRRASASLHDVGHGARRRARRVVPARLAVAPPEHRQRPARQLLARVPLALTEVQETAGAVLPAQPLHQFGRRAALGRRRAPRCSTPAPSRSSTETKVGSPPIVSRTSPPRSLRRPVVPPRTIGAHCSSVYGLVTRGVLEDARHLHRVENSTSHSSTARDRCGRRRVRRAGERDVAFAGQQARGRVQPDPAGAGQIDLAPGVQVGEVVLGARRAVERLHVGLQLDQVAGDEARRQAEVAQRPAPAASRCRGRSRGEPSVSSGVCTPGSMRIR